MEWQWGAPSTNATFPSPHTAATEGSASAAATASMLVDLNSAFAQAFGAPVPESPATVRRKGHSRGLSTVFVSPAPSPDPEAADSNDATTTTSDESVAAVVGDGSGDDKRSAVSVNTAAAATAHRAEALSPRHALLTKAVVNNDRKRQLERREKVVRELLSSEKVYVDNLTKLIELFYKPLTGRESLNTTALTPPSSAPMGAPILGRSSTSLPAVSLLTRTEADSLFGQVSDTRKILCLCGGAMCVWHR